MKILVGILSAILFVSLCLSGLALREAGREIERVRGERDQERAEIAAHKETAAKAKMELAISQLAVKLCREEKAMLTIAAAPPPQNAIVRLEDVVPKPQSPVSKEQAGELLKLMLKLLM